MKKINPSKDACESYRQKTDIHIVPAKACWSCFYNLFACCWLTESLAENKTVNRALEGFDEAKAELHRKLML